MSAYDSDSRVSQHPDGSWTVTDFRSEWFVLPCNGRWDAFDANGYPVDVASGKATKDGAVRALIGDPQ